MNRLPVVLLLIAFIGCQSDSRESNNIAEETHLSEFEVYLNSLDTIPIPFNHWVFGELPKLSVDYDTALYPKFKHVWTRLPLGILYREPSYTALIDCSVGDYGLAPFIVTYDDNGKKLDSLGIYEKSGFDQNYKAVEYLTITKSHQIIVLDSVFTSTDIDTTYRLKSSDTTVYMITQSGEIVKTNR